MRVVGNWLKRVRISIRGFALWLKVGYPFVILFLGVLVVALMRGANWLHIWIILTLGATLTIAEMLNYAIERLCDVVKPKRDGRIKDIKDICFPLGTKILVRREISNKNYKYRRSESFYRSDCSESIENIKVGDKVLSYNEKTGKKELKDVVKVHSRKSGEFVLLKFSNNNELRCTPNHTIAVNSKGKIKWVVAKELRKGDECIQYKHSGLSLRLRSITERGKSFSEIHRDRAEELRQRISNALLGNVPHNKGKSYEELYGSKRARELKDGVSLVHKNLKSHRKGLSYIEQYGEEGARRVTKASSISHKKRWRNPQFAQKMFNDRYGRSFKMNGWEKKLSYILRNVAPGEWRYVGDGKVFIAGKCPDFININGKKKIIELNSEYWHTDKARDKERVKLFKKYGFDTLILTDSDLFGDKGGIVKKIKDFSFNPNIEVVRVEEVKRYFEGKSINVYNLEVEDNNNYFARGILVHNCSGTVLVAGLALGIVGLWIIITC